MLMSCQKKDIKNKHFSDKNEIEFLNIISKNTIASIDDITESTKQPTNNFVIYTKYPLSKDKVSEYKKNGVLNNSDNDISDFASYEIKDYDLVNEKNEKLELINTGNAKVLQETSIGEQGQILQQNLMIKLKTDKKFETLKGHINMEYKMPSQQVLDKKIIVNVSIQDTVPE